MVSPENISAFILAGGKSSRMGSDKGLVRFHGRKMIEHVISNIPLPKNQIAIINGNPAYQIFDCTIYNDIYKNCGPLGGIYAALYHSTTDWNFIIGCDMPFVSKDFISFLMKKISDQTAIVPVHDAHVEPLCALYHRSNLSGIQNLLQHGELKMQNAIKIMNAELCDVSLLFSAEEIFRNINSPEDISKQTHDAL